MVRLCQSRCDAHFLGGGEAGGRLQVAAGPHQVGDDIAYATLFSSAMSFVTYEGQMIWSRYNALLVANAFVATLLAAISGPLTGAKGSNLGLDAIFMLGAISGLY